MKNARWMGEGKNNPILETAFPHSKNLKEIVGQEKCPINLVPMPTIL
jgi:hypothetical protein